MPDETAVSAVQAAPPGRATPRSTAEVVEAVRSARAGNARLRVVGAGTWPSAGRPVVASRTLELSGLTGITEYIPGDLTLTARAGTSLAEIAEATGSHRQWLPLDPFGDPRGTLGATLATASVGPLGASMGLPRDVAVGLAFVSGEGDVVQGGGRVVKNVAGFDLVRLTIGAWGTLGVIVEATVRLRARPEADETVAVTLPDESDALDRLLTTVRTAAVEPLAAELLSPATAARLGLSDGAVMLVRVAGNPVGVNHQVATLRRLATCRNVSPEVWSRLQTSDPESVVVIRVSRRPSELARLWMTATSTPGVDAHATMARGIVRLRLTTPEQAAILTTFGSEDLQVVESVAEAFVVRLEPSARVAVDPISQRLRLAFDPHGLLNRGVFGEETA